MSDSTGAPGAAPMDDDDWGDDDAPAPQSRGTQRRANTLAATSGPRPKRLRSSVDKGPGPAPCAPTAAGLGSSCGDAVLEQSHARPKLLHGQAKATPKHPSALAAPHRAATVAPQRRHRALAKAVGVTSPAARPGGPAKALGPAQPQHVPLRVGTECSGMEPVMMALCNIGLADRCSLEFCCEKDTWCRTFISQNHCPKKLLSDITTRPAATMPHCDLYVAGFPCQPFSSAGLRQGRDDASGRGTIIDHIINYLRHHHPRAFILENVIGITSTKFADTFQHILLELRAITGDDGSHYIVTYRVVNTANWGLPHHRERVYIIGLWTATMNKASPFLWPRAATNSVPIDDLLDSTCTGGPAALGSLGPSCRTKLQAYLQQLCSAGHNPHKDTWIIDVFSSKIHGMKGQSPCLTRTRCGAGGHWVSNLSRLLTVPEMLSLQGMSSNTLNRVGISNRQMGLMIGNAMSVNVLERLLLRLLPAVGLADRSCLQDRWH